MRGQRSLYNSLFPEKVQVQKEISRPRNYFQPERNEAVVYRFYFYAYINDLKYEQCLEKLEREFYLTSSRLIKVLTDSNDMLNRVSNESPSVKELEIKFPHFTWRELKRA